MKTIHIIGGGISGCAFAYFLKKDFNIILYEKSPNLGGLIRTNYSIEGIPWQQTPSILHTDKDWIVELFSKYINLVNVKYEVAMNPLFDLRYYNYPFNKSSINTMPWHWKEAILMDLETSNGENAKNIEHLINNFYGDTVYDIFYKNYFKRMFGKDELDLVDWYRPMMRNVNEDFDHYIEKHIMFPVDQGWNKLFDGLTNNVDIRLNTDVNILDFNPDDSIILTSDVTKFYNVNNAKIYSYGSFDIDSTIYKNNSPDTMIFPNYTPFISLTQFGRYFTKYEKNIIVKTFIDDGDIPLYPIPTKLNKKKYLNIINDPWIIGKNNNKIYYNNIINAGRTGSWSFMSISDVMDQAQKISAEIKHKKRSENRS